MQKRRLKIGDKYIGEEYPCFIIAEAGANFKISEDSEVNFKHALTLIDLAVDAKADAVKFQLYSAKKLYVKNAGSANYIGKEKSIFEIIKEMELPKKWLPKLKNYCDNKEIIFLCTPFDEESVDELEKINIEAYKIASYSISHIPLLKYIAGKNKPIIMSTGASNLIDIEKAINALRSEGNDKTAIMQCTAKYPAPLENINLKVIPMLKERFNVPVGLSDHSREPFIAPMGAVALGAKIIEKHYTTDNNLPGPDHGFAILTDELKELVFNIHALEKCLGSMKKDVQQSEKELYNFCRRKIFASKDIKKGEIFTRKNLAILRGGEKRGSLEPEKINEIINKIAKKDIKLNEPIQEEHFK